jgi:hypothetical protein
MDNIDDLMKYVVSVFSSNYGLEFGIYDNYNSIMTFEFVV